MGKWHLTGPEKFVVLFLFWVGKIKFFGKWGE